MENGSKKLKLSVQKMKKLKSNVAAGGFSFTDHSGSVTWAYEQPNK